MRQIKFRAWDGKQMMNRLLTDRNWYTDDNKCVCGARPEDATNLEIMQFTGLQDKNGVDVYEGDILKIDDDNDESIFEVVWVGSSWAKKYEGWPASLDYPLLDIVDMQFFYVVGNIHETQN